MEFKPSEFREEAEQNDKEDVGEVKSDKLNKIIKKKTVFFVDFYFRWTEDREEEDEEEEDEDEEYWYWYQITILPF